MLVLLPPSEGKTPPAGGDPLDLSALAYAGELGALRAELLDALERLGRAPLGKALEALAISPGQSAEVGVDAALRTAPAAPAAAVYSGVLYDRLRLAELPAKARRQVLIASALWGVVRPDDRIPYYRLSAKARLPGVGPLAAYWRPALAPVLPDEEGELLIDMRSAAYAAAWKPRRAVHLAVRAFSEERGMRRAVSHMAKAVRGEVARVLLGARSVPSGPEDAAHLLSEAGHRVELGPGSLDVIVSAVP